jgi:hypothetical protein
MVQGKPPSLKDFYRKMLTIANKGEIFEPTNVPSAKPLPSAAMSPENKVHITEISDAFFILTENFVGFHIFIF